MNSLLSIWQRWDLDPHRVFRVQFSGVFPCLVQPLSLYPHYQITLEPLFSGLGPCLVCLATSADVSFALAGGDLG